jgi:cytochrome o ubiquinol oxidase subunit 2
VIVLTLYFAWKYRASNMDATYTPNWSYSHRIEAVCWGIPIAIIVVLGAITWKTTHELDPFRPIDSSVKPMTIEVVALDWKWLFIYPELGIATVNELAAPIDVPISFKITASSVMNSFFIPSLAGQIYAMPGMETKLHAVMNQPGVYDGFSANYSGAGFSGMHFKFHGLSPADFDRWVQGVKAGNTALTRSDYLQLEKPSEREPVRRYASVAPDLYKAILNRCVASGQMCMNQMMAIDASGGLGKNMASVATQPWRVADNGESAPRRYVEALMCSADNPEGKPLLQAELAAK